MILIIVADKRVREACNAELLIAGNGLVAVVLPNVERDDLTAGRGKGDGVRTWSIGGAGRGRTGV
jgi:hypothetical protein